MEEEAKPVTIYAVIEIIEAFIDRHRRVNDQRDRWFSMWLLNTVLPIARRIRSGGLNEAEQKLVAQFRLDEISRERADKQREIDLLDKEARGLAA